MLDGNSVAGLLHELFGTEMTATPAECAHCGLSSEIGAMLAFGRSMGMVLRCPTCQEVTMRMVDRGSEVWIDMQGIAYLRLTRTEGQAPTP
jgi:hypothetical protein